jgi:Domain of unknown function (DUF4214)
MSTDISTAEIESVFENPKNVAFVIGLKGEDQLTTGYEKFSAKIEIDFDRLKKFVKAQQSGDGWGAVSSFIDIPRLKWEVNNSNNHTGNNKVFDIETSAFRAGSFSVLLGNSVEATAGGALTVKAGGVVNLKFQAPLAVGVVNAYSSAGWSAAAATASLEWEIPGTQELLQRIATARLTALGLKVVGQGAAATFTGPLGTVLLLADIAATSAELAVWGFIATSKPKITIGLAAAAKLTVGIENGQSYVSFPGFSKVSRSVINNELRNATIRAGEATIGKIPGGDQVLNFLSSGYIATDAQQRDVMKVAFIEAVNKGQQISLASLNNLARDRYDTQRIKAVLNAMHIKKYSTISIIQGLSALRGLPDTSKPLAQGNSNAAQYVEAMKNIDAPVFYVWKALSDIFSISRSQTVFLNYFKGNQRGISLDNALNQWKIGYLAANGANKAAAANFLALRNSNMQKVAGYLVGKGINFDFGSTVLRAALNNEYQSRYNASGKATRYNVKSTNSVAAEWVRRGGPYVIAPTFNGRRFVGETLVVSSNLQELGLDLSGDILEQFAMDGFADGDTDAPDNNSGDDESDFATVDISRSYDVISAFNFFVDADTGTIDVSGLAQHLNELVLPDGEFEGYSAELLTVAIMAEYDARGFAAETRASITQTLTFFNDGFVDATVKLLSTIADGGAETLTRILRVELDRSGIAINERTTTLEAILAAAPFIDTVLSTQIMTAFNTLGTFTPTDITINRGGVTAEMYLIRDDLREILLSYDAADADTTINNLKAYAATGLSAEEFVRNLSAVYQDLNTAADLRATLAGRVDAVNQGTIAALRADVIELVNSKMSDADIARYSRTFMDRLGADASARPGVLAGVFTIDLAIVADRKTTVSDLIANPSGLPIAQNTDDWAIVHAFVSEIGKQLVNYPNLQAMLGSIENVQQSVTLIEGIAGLVNKNDAKAGDKLLASLDYFGKQNSGFGEILNAAKTIGAIGVGIAKIADGSLFPLIDQELAKLLKGNLTVGVGKALDGLKSIGALSPELFDTLTRVNKAVGSVVGIKDAFSNAKGSSGDNSLKAYGQFKTLLGAVFTGADAIKVAQYADQIETVYKTIQSGYNAINNAPVFNDDGTPKLDVDGNPVYATEAGAWEKFLGNGTKILTDTNLFRPEFIADVKTVAASYQVIQNTANIFANEKGAAGRAIDAIEQNERLRNLVGAEGLKLIKTSKAIYEIVQGTSEWARTNTGGEQLLVGIDAAIRTGNLDPSISKPLAIAAYGYKAVQSSINAVSALTAGSRVPDLADLRDFDFPDADVNNWAAASAELANVSSAVSSVAALKIFDAATNKTLNDISVGVDVARKALTFLGDASLLNGISLAAMVAGLLSKDPVVALGVQIANVALASNPVGWVLLGVDLIFRLFSETRENIYREIRTGVDVDRDGSNDDSEGAHWIFTSNWLKQTDEYAGGLKYNVNSPGANAVSSARVTLTREESLVDKASFWLGNPPPDYVPRIVNVLRIDANFNAINPVTDGQTVSQRHEISEADAATWRASMGGDVADYVTNDPRLSDSGPMATWLRSLTLGFDTNQIPYDFTYQDVNGDGNLDLVRGRLDLRGIKNNELVPNLLARSFLGQQATISNLGDSNTQVTLLDRNGRAISDSINANSNEELSDKINLSNILMTWGASHTELWGRVLEGQSVATLNSWGVSRFVPSLDLFYRMANETGAIKLMKRAAEIDVALAGIGKNSITTEQATELYAEAGQISFALGLKFNGVDYLTNASANAAARTSLLTASLGAPLLAIMDSFIADPASLNATQLDILQQAATASVVTAATLLTGADRKAAIERAVFARVNPDTVAYNYVRYGNAAGIAVNSSGETLAIWNAAAAIADAATRNWIQSIYHPGWFLGWGGWTQYVQQYGTVNTGWGDDDYEYAPDGAIAHVTQFNLDGTRRRLSFDWSKSKSWNWTQNTFAADSTRQTQTGLTDDGISWAASFKPGSLNNHLLIGNPSIDAPISAALLNGTAAIGAGGEIARLLMVSPDKSTRVDEFGANGVLIRREAIDAAGVVTTTLYGADGLVTQITVEDKNDGATNLRQFNAVGAVMAETSTLNRFTETLITETKMLNADGTTTTTLYDAMNDTAWTSQATTTNAAGDPLRVETIRDNGSTRLEVMTTNASQTYVSAVEERNAQGLLTRQAGTRANGDIYETVYDGTKADGALVVVSDTTKLNDGSIITTATGAAGSEFVSTRTYVNRIGNIVRQTGMYADGRIADAEYDGLQGSDALVTLVSSISAAAITTPTGGTGGTDTMTGGTGVTTLPGLTVFKPTSIPSITSDVTKTVSDLIGSTAWESAASRAAVTTALLTSSTGINLGTQGAGLAVAANPTGLIALGADMITRQLKPAMRTGYTTVTGKLDLDNDGRADDVILDGKYVVVTPRADLFKSAAVTVNTNNFYNIQYVNPDGEYWESATVSQQEWESTYSGYWGAQVLSSYTTYSVTKTANYAAINPATDAKSVSVTETLTAAQAAAWRTEIGGNSSTYLPNDPRLSAGAVGVWFQDILSVSYDNGAPFAFSYRDVNGDGNVDLIRDRVTTAAGDMSRFFTPGFLGERATLTTMADAQVQVTLLDKNGNSIVNSINSATDAEMNEKLALSNLLLTWGASHPELWGRALQGAYIPTLNANGVDRYIPDITKFYQLANESGALKLMRRAAEINTALATTGVGAATTDQAKALYAEAGMISLALGLNFDPVAYLQNASEQTSVRSEALTTLLGAPLLAAMDAFTANPASLTATQLQLLNTSASATAVTSATEMPLVAERKAAIEAAVFARVNALQVTEHYLTFGNARNIATTTSGDVAPISSINAAVADGNARNWVQSIYHPGWFFGIGGWTQYVQHYGTVSAGWGTDSYEVNADNSPVVVNQTNTDGSKRTLRFDPSNGQSWQWVQDTFNAAGKHLTQTGLTDAGMSWAANFTTGIQPTTPGISDALINGTAAAGANGDIARLVVAFPDGATRVDDFGATGTITKRIAVPSVGVTSTTVYMNGLPTLTTVENVPAGTTSTSVYDATGKLTQTTTVSMPVAAATYASDIAAVGANLINEQIVPNVRGGYTTVKGALDLDNDGNADDTITGSVVYNIVTPKADLLKSAAVSTSSTNYHDISYIEYEYGWVNLTVTEQDLPNYYNAWGFQVSSSYTTYSLTKTAVFNAPNPATAVKTVSTQENVTAAQFTAWRTELSGASATLSANDPRLSGSGLVGTWYKSVTNPLSYDAANPPFVYSYRDVNGDGTLDLIRDRVNTAANDLPSRLLTAGFLGQAATIANIGDAKVQVTLLDKDGRDLGDSINAASDVELNDKLALANVLMTWGASHPELWGRILDGYSTSTISSYGLSRFVPDVALFYRLANETGAMPLMRRAAEIQTALAKTGTDAPTAAQTQALYTEAGQISVALGIRFNSDAYLANASATPAARAQILGGVLGTSLLAAMDAFAANPAALTAAQQILLHQVVGAAAVTAATALSAAARKAAIETAVFAQVSPLVAADSYLTIGNAKGIAVTAGGETLAVWSAAQAIADANSRNAGKVFDGWGSDTYATDANGFTTMSQTNVDGSKRDVITAPASQNVPWLWVQHTTGADSRELTETGLTKTGETWTASFRTGMGQAGPAIDSRLVAGNAPAGTAGDVARLVVVAADKSMRIDEFDANGRLVKRTAVDIAGVATVSRYDATGALTDSMVIPADGVTVVQKFNATGTLELETQTTRLNGETVTVQTVALNADGTLTTTGFDILDRADWDQKATIRDAQGKAIKVETLLDDGSRGVSLIGGDANVGYKSITAYRNADGFLKRETGVRLSGESFDTVYDGLKADDELVTLSTTITGVDGSSVTVKTGSAVAADGNASTTTYRTAAGTIIRESGAKIDGTVVDTVYSGLRPDTALLVLSTVTTNTDRTSVTVLSGSALPTDMTALTTTRNALGYITQQTGTMANGDRFDVTFDGNNPDASAVLITDVVTHPDGRMDYRSVDGLLVRQTGTRSNGDQYDTTYDGQQPDTSLVRLTDVTTRPDGSTDKYYAGSAAAATAYVTYTDTRNAAGNLVRRTGKLANGSTVDIAYDGLQGDATLKALSTVTTAVDGSTVSVFAGSMAEAVGTTTTTVYRNADGNLVRQTGTRPDGDQFDIAYDGLHNDSALVQLGAIMTKADGSVENRNAQGFLVNKTGTHADGSTYVIVYDGVHADDALAKLSNTTTHSDGSTVATYTGTTAAAAGFDSYTVTRNAGGHQTGLTGTEANGDQVVITYDGLHTDDALVQLSHVETHPSGIVDTRNVVGNLIRQTATLANGDKVVTAYDGLHSDAALVKLSDTITKPDGTSVATYTTAAAAAVGLLDYVIERNAQGKQIRQTGTRPNGETFAIAYDGLQGDDALMRLSVLTTFADGSKEQTIYGSTANDKSYVAFTNYWNAAGNLTRQTGTLLNGDKLDTAYNGTSLDDTVGKLTILITHPNGLSETVTIGALATIGDFVSYTTYRDASGNFIRQTGTRANGDVYEITDKLNAPAGQTLIGTRGHDALYGGRSNDVLAGKGGGDILRAGDGDDQLMARGSIMPTENALAVKRLYLATLNRGPEDAGWADWTQSLDQGQSLQAITTGFVNSSEFVAKYGELDATKFVTLLYNNVLHRDPDLPGLASWTSSINSGSTRERVVTGFSESAEFINQTDSNAHIAQAYRLYGATLDRQPDAEGLAGWAGALDDGMTLNTIAAGFVNSAEFQSKYGALDDGAFVSLLYNNVLHRNAEPEGFTNWKSLLDGGTSRTEVVIGFSESQEFKNNTADPMVSYMRTANPAWNSILDGGAGNDTISGGMGADTFVFTQNALGSDHIYDFQSWDTLQLSGFGYADAAAAFSHMTQSGANVVFADQGQTITFHGNSLGQVLKSNVAVS